jgi:hypothetical protein
MATKKKTASQTRAGRGSDQFIVRMPPGMRDFIAKIAEHEGRSMNTEIILALTKHMASYDPNAKAVDVSAQIMQAIKERHTPNPYIIQDIAEYLRLFARGWGESDGFELPPFELPAKEPTEK